MMNTIEVKHVRESSNLSFADFTANFEKQLGRHDVSAYKAELDKESDPQDVVRVLKGQEGSSGFMLFTTYDHGALLNIKWKARVARQYILGNPLFASEMTKHDIRAALYAPLRALIYEDDSGQVQIEYDLPSSLFGQFNNDLVTKVALDLDRKMAALVENSMGNKR